MEYTEYSKSINASNELKKRNFGFYSVLLLFKVPDRVTITYTK